MNWVLAGQTADPSALPLADLDLPAIQLTQGAMLADGSWHDPRVNDRLAELTRLRVERDRTCAEVDHLESTRQERLRRVAELAQEPDENGVLRRDFEQLDSTAQGPRRNALATGSRESVWHIPLSVADVNYLMLAPWSHRPPEERPEFQGLLWHVQDILRGGLMMVDAIRQQLGLSLVADLETAMPGIFEIQPRTLNVQSNSALGSPGLLRTGETFAPATRINLPVEIDYPDRLQLPHGHPPPPLLPRRWPTLHPEQEQRLSDIEEEVMVMVDNQQRPHNLHTQQAEATAHVVWNLVRESRLAPSQSQNSPSDTHRQDIIPDEQHEAYLDRFVETAVQTALAQDSLPQTEFMLRQNERHFHNLVSESVRASLPAEVRDNPAMLADEIHRQWMRRVNAVLARIDEARTLQDRVSVWTRRDSLFRPDGGLTGNFRDSAQAHGRSESRASSPSSVVTDPFAEASTLLPRPQLDSALPSHGSNEQLNTVYLPDTRQGNARTWHAPASAPAAIMTPRETVGRAPRARPGRLPARSQRAQRRRRMFDEQGTSRAALGADGEYEQHRRRFWAGSNRRR